MASLMANEAGRAFGAAHLLYTFSFLFGQILTGVAGVFDGLTFFRQGQRWHYIKRFMIVFAIQVAPLT